MVRGRGITFSPGQALEFRVKLTPADDSDQSGLWPAVWASGWGQGGWPAAGELDFLEVMTANNPKRSIYSIHYAKPDGSHGVANRPVIGGDNFSASWHTVRFEYGHGGNLVWYQDGVEVFSVSAVETAQGFPRPFDLPITELKINLALGGRPGPLSPNAVGATGARFEVDFVRIRQL
jgi:beta-glucanase (GH16 family)